MQYQYGRRVEKLKFSSGMGSIPAREPALERQPRKAFQVPLAGFDHRFGRTISVRAEVSKLERGPFALRYLRANGGTSGCGRNDDQAPLAFPAAGYGSTATGIPKNPRGQTARVFLLPFMMRTVCCPRILFKPPVISSFADPRTGKPNPSTDESRSSPGPTLQHLRYLLLPFSRP